MTKTDNTYNAYYKQNKISENENIASLKIFKSAGFEPIFSNSDVITLKRLFKKISFKEVVEEDCDVLFELLKKRAHSISHQSIPTKNEHIQFMKAKPYRYWVVVLDGIRPVGTFYLQSDNSIGLNLLQPTRSLVSDILQHIQESFEPMKEVKSIFYNQNFFSVVSKKKF